MNKDIVWTKQEDAIITKAYEKYGADWQRISSLFFDKSADQCRTRYEEAISARNTIWTREDDEALIKEVEKYSTRWRTIGTILQKPADECRKRFAKLTNSQNDAPSFLVKDIADSVVSNDQDLALIAQQRLQLDQTDIIASPKVSFVCPYTTSDEKYVIDSKSMELYIT